MPVPGLPAPAGARAERDPLDVRAVFEKSGLFQAAWYLREYQDVLAAGTDPLEHFCRDGWREGRKPNPHFDPAWYLRTYAAEVGPDTNPLLDYIVAGEAAGRKPGPDFDPAKYRLRHGLSAEQSPLRHYLAPGVVVRVMLAIGKFVATTSRKWRRQIRHRIRVLSPRLEDQLARLMAAMRNRDRPRLSAGKSLELRSPRRAGIPEPFSRLLSRLIRRTDGLPICFDPQLYLEANPDVAAAGMDPAAHYRRFGKAERRPIRPVTPTVTDRAAAKRRM